jgi:DNA repair photolyase
VGSGVEYREVECKSALTRVQGMPFAWSLNPYRGCEHSCGYCYARDYHRRMGRDTGAGFDREIEIKTNFVERLRDELAHGKSGAVALGTGTDPYQPCEGKYRLTCGTLAALLERPLPLTLITKGTLIVRDVDLLAALSARTGGDVRVCFSIGTVDETLARTLEPKAPPPAKRLLALRRLRAAGVQAGVLCAPVVPGVTDSEDAIEAVAHAAHTAGAYSFGWRPLKLDPGVRDGFLALIAAEFPVLLPRYMERYANGPHCDPAYIGVLERRVARVRSRYRFPDEDEEREPEPEIVPPRQLKLAM